MKKYFLCLSCALLLLMVSCVKDNSMRDHRIFGEALQNYYQTRFEDNLRRYENRIRRARTREDALKIVREAQARVRKTWKFPARKSPLNAKVHKVFAGNGFTVENITFQSRPGFTVTANFYLPAGRKGKVPAILFLQGHSDNGKQGYPTACSNFARMGIAVLSIDPIQQGERNQYGPGRCVNSTLGHNRMNRQLMALGETLSDWRTYDGIRAVDYLLTRPEVDPARIGINGNSGGGTMTTLIFANDHRIAAAAPSCYITTFCENVRNELAVDGEQIPAGYLSSGGEMADLILARAPQPFCIISQKGDFFDLRGARKTYALAKKIYTLLGKGDNISHAETPGPHRYSQGGRQHARAFFASVFGLKPLEKEEKPAFDNKLLNCLDEKGVSGLKGEKSLLELGKEQAARLRLERQKKPLTKRQLQKKLRTLLDVGRVPENPAYRSLRMTEIDKILFRRVGITPEKFITATLFYRSDWDFEIRAGKEAVLMLPHISSREELVKYFTPETARSLFALDPRGMGESEPSTTERLRRLYWDYGADYHYASLGLLLGKPFVGRRVFDILCAINLISAHGAEKITLKAFGHSRYPAIFAAFLSDKKVKLELVGGMPVTYEQAFSDPSAPIPQSGVPLGILKIADIDEIVAHLKDGENKGE